MRLRTIFLMAIFIAICSIAAATGKPLKVYILAGQSNMQEHTKVETFDYIDDDLATAPLLEEMRSPDDKLRIREKVWTCREFNGCLYEVCFATHLKDSSDLLALPEL